MSHSTHPGRRAKLIFLLVLLTGSLILCAEAWRIEGLPQWSSAGAFPLAMAGIMTAALVWDALQLWRKTAPQGRFREFVSVGWLGFVLLALGFVVLLDIAGFWIAAVLFLWAAVFFLHRGRAGFALVLALCIGTTVYALFTWVFKVNLP